MRKRREQFKRRVMFADEAGVTVDHLCNGYEYRVVVTDAREPTAKQALAKALQAFEDANGVFHSELHPTSVKMARAAGFKASKKNNKVLVREIRERPCAPGR